MKRIKDTRLTRRLLRMATHPYSVRDAQMLLEIEGYRRPSLDFIWQFFRDNRKGKVWRSVRSV